MKRHIILPSMAISLVAAFIIIFLQEGYYIATLLRNDLLYFMLYIPLISMLLIFGVVYMGLGINWKQNILIDWYKILAIISFVFSMIVLLFMPSIYITVSTGGQATLVVAPFVLLIVSSIFVFMNGKTSHSNML